MEYLNDVLQQEGTSVFNKIEHYHIGPFWSKIG